MDKVKQNHIARLNEISQSIVMKSRQRIDFSKPIITREDCGVIYPNTINIVQGKSGVHKSRLVEVILASLLSKSTRREHLGFETTIEEPIFCVYADTERNLKEQFPYAIQNLKRLTDTELEHDLINFKPLSFIEFGRNERFSILKQYLDSLRETEKEKHLFIVLDVVTDCIENFNDPKASLQLIDLMNAYINEYNVTFLCVIHENPNSGDKARGHLGTELLNKSSTVLQISFDSPENELIKVKYLKCRRTKRSDPIYLVYCEDAKGLVLADKNQVQKSKDDRKTKAQIGAVKNWIRDYLFEHGSTSKNDLIEALKEKFNCGSRTIEDRLKQIEEGEGELFTDEQNQVFYLDKYKKGRVTFFELKTHTKE